MNEAIAKCGGCRGEGIKKDPSQLQVGFRVCRRCRGIGLLAIDSKPERAHELEPHELAPWSAHYEPRGAE